jgi:hypothetical protein
MLGALPVISFRRYDPGNLTNPGISFWMLGNLIIAEAFVDPLLSAGIKFRLSAFEFKALFNLMVLIF